MLSSAFAWGLHLLEEVLVFALHDFPSLEAGRTEGEFLVQELLNLLGPFLFVEEHRRLAPGKVRGFGNGLDFGGGVEKGLRRFGQVFGNASGAHLGGLDELRKQRRARNLKKL